MNHQAIESREKRLCKTIELILIHKTACRSWEIISYVVMVNDIIFDKKPTQSY